MIRRFVRGRAGVWAGVIGLLAAAGCGKPPSRVADVPPPTEPPVVSTPTEPTPPTEPSPPTTPVTKPTDSGVTGGIPYTPRPNIPTGGKPTYGNPAFVPPSSPTFTAPETLGGTQPPGTPPVPPPTDPMPPPPTDPIPQPPTDPMPPTGTLQPTKPEEVKYPEEVAGKNLEGWLKELQYTGGGPVQRDDKIREDAVKAIPWFGPDARKPAIKPLIEAIRIDPDPGVQIAAINVISSMGFEMREEVRPVMSVLIQRLRAAPTGSIVKMYCVRSLASFGPDAAASVKDLARSCLDPSWETRREVAIALSLVGGTPRDEKGLPKKDAGPDLEAINTLLTYQLQDRSVAVRYEAAMSLLALGPPYAKTPQEVLTLTEKPRKVLDQVVKFEGGKGPKYNTRGGSPDRGVYAWALLLQMMYDDTTLDNNLLELAKLVAEPDGPNADQVRLYAIQALGAGGGLFAREDLQKETKEAAVGALADALMYDHQPMLQYTTLQALALIGKNADTALPAVEKLAASKPKPPPPEAPKGTPPDDSLQRLAKQTAEVLVGKRKIEDFGKEDPKPDEVKAPAPK